MTASYSILIKRSAEKELRTVPKPDIQRIAEKIQALGADPRPKGCVKLAGLEGYRIRQGDWRVLYEIEDKKHEVSVYKIGHRREIYL